MESYPCWVVFYHYIRGQDAERGRGIRALSTADFRRQLEWLEKRAEIIGYEAFERAVERGTGFDRPAVLLTFDDGLRDHWDEVYPELRRRGLSAVFFVTGGALEEPPALMNVHRTHLLLDSLGADALQREMARALERDAEPGWREAADLYRYDGEPEQVVKRLLNYVLPYDETDRLLEDLFTRHVGDPADTARRFYLSAEQVRQMAAGGMTFGYHTARHRVLSRLAPRELERELAGGVALVRGLTGQASVPFCYPYGHRQTYTADTVRLLGQLGYSMAFNTVRQAARPGTDDRFEIPRFDTRDLPPLGSATIHPRQGVPS